MQKKVFLYIIVFFLFSQTVNAQFYNGLQMTFGKNRVQHRTFNWLFYRYDAYDIYFYDQGERIALFTGDYAKEAITDMELMFDYKLQKRLIFLIYNTQTDFKQSNIGLETGNVEFNTGGTTMLNDNKIFIFYETDHQKLKKQIRRVVAQIFVNEMLYGSALKDKVANSTLLTLPEWYENGLIEYAAQGWNFETENLTKDAILSGKFKNFNHLTGKEARLLGHSLWYYISEVYGKDAIPSILYFTRINKNAISGFTYVTGMSIKYLKPDWELFYLDIFESQEAKQDLPTEEILKKRRNKKTAYQQVKINPRKNMVAYVANTMGKYQIFIHDLDTDKKKKIYQEGQKLEQITDFSYPLMAWHPSGKILSFITEEKGQLIFTRYEIENKKYVKSHLHKISKVTSFNYSHNGRQIVLSAVKDGYTDIFLMNAGTGTLKQITNDLADDLNPSFSDNSTKVIFSSNRISDTLKIERKYEDHSPTANFFDLFIYDIKSKSDVLQRLTNTKYVNETQATEIDKNKYVYLSDENGIINRHTITYDSTISHIDTTVHYRYFTTNYPQTNYRRNIISYDIKPNSKQIVELIYNNNRYNIYLSDFKAEKDNKLIQKFKNSSLRNDLNQTYKLNDSLAEIRKQKIIDEQNKIDSMPVELPEKYKNPDSLTLDITNYTFEIEKDTIYRLYYLKHKKDITKKENDDKLQAWYYEPVFYMDGFTSQFDFGMLNQSYQVFTGGTPYYFNPGMNLFMKMGVNELFEDYKIMGGFKMGFNLKTYEYLFSVENLSKRLDKQWVYHRKSYGQDLGYVSSLGYIQTKVISNELMYIMRYPFNQTTSFKTTFDTRLDQDLYQSTGWNTLTDEIRYNIFASVKGEFIHDHVQSLGLNLYDGIRYKIFGEFHQKTHGNYDFIGILGADFRFYQKIHRNLIFASRFAASTSFGTGKLLYYLGGVDNWYSLLAMFGETDAIFIPTDEIGINPNENYIYQAVGTNMRGFRQNIRNGNSFAVMNNEIRFPIIRYLANQPINSDFFNNFQIVGFFDVGSAWSGLTPFDEANAYNQVIEENGPVTLIIEVDRPPFVAGYGWGLRSKLFGYFFRLDWAWGIEGYHVHPRQFYFSLNLDF